MGIGGQREGGQRPAPDGLVVRRVGTQPVDPVSILGGARHFQCVNDIALCVKQ